MVSVSDETDRDVSLADTSTTAPIYWLLAIASPKNQQLIAIVGHVQLPR
jgi:hypothetical protein